MAMFQLDIAFLLELALFATGLIVLHLGREKSAGLLKAAAAVLLVGSVLTAVCSGYFGVRYHVQGDFDRAYPAHQRVGAPEAAYMQPHGPMGQHGMHPPMARPEMMGSAAPAEPAPDNAEDTGSHEEHHPEAGSGSPSGDR